MRQSQEFFKTILKSLNPDSYRSLSARSYKEVHTYFFSLIFFALIIAVIIALPKIIAFPQNFENTLQKFNQLEIDIKAELPEPILIPETNPLIKIGGNKTKERLTITKDAVKWNGLFIKKTINVTEFANPLEHKQKMVSAATTLMVIAIPLILIALFLLFSAKYMLIILATSATAFVIVRLINYEIKIRHVFKITIYSSTLMILAEIINIPINLNLFYIPLIIYLIYVTMGIFLVGEKPIKRR